MRLAHPFHHRDATVGRYVRNFLFVTGWPPYPHIVDYFIRSESEMKLLGVLREKAGASTKCSRQFAVAGPDHDFGTDGVAVRPGPAQADRECPALVPVVANDTQTRGVSRFDDKVQITVTVEVARRE